MRNLLRPPPEISFLIHYGWRGTDHVVKRLPGADRVSNPLRLEGDPCQRVDDSLFTGVSNPLRLEGDHPGGITPHRIFYVSNPLRLEGDILHCYFGHIAEIVSNPLRLEGDSWVDPEKELKAKVSNPLRLEGDLFVALTIGCVVLFLIHYGWRGTFPRSNL